MTPTRSNPVAMNRPSFRIGCRTAHWLPEKPRIRYKTIRAPTRIVDRSAPILRTRVGRTNTPSGQFKRLRGAIPLLSPLMIESAQRPIKGTSAKLFQVERLDIPEDMRNIEALRKFGIGRVATEALCILVIGFHRGICEMN
jgi:hypothetical protein